MNYTEILKIIKGLIMKYGLWTTLSAFSLAVAFPVFMWKFPDISNALLEWAKFLAK